MTRILYWNVNNFSLSKIYYPVWGDPYRVMAAHARLEYMINILKGPDVAGAPPDIIVIVEVFKRTGEVDTEGRVLDPGSDGGEGVFYLLDAIRADPTLSPVGANWCVVPPLRLGQYGHTESVAVFYNATNVQFTGPNLLYYLHGGGHTPVVGVSEPVDIATYPRITKYPDAWEAVLPTMGRTTNFTINGAPQAIPENRLAGEWQYYNLAMGVRPIPSPLPPVRAPNRINFPDQSCRGPFYTRFLDLATARTIKLFAVHTSPATAQLAIGRMSLISEMTAVAANEVNVVLGDFNFDTFDAFNGHPWNRYYWMVSGVNGNCIYAIALDPRDPATGVVNMARKPYCMTHFLPQADATPYNNSGGVTDPQHNVYPRYGYMGSVYRGINDTGAIDNIFTSYGAGAGGPATNITVINTLTGTPYNAFAAPAGVTAELTAGLQYNSMLAPLNYLITNPPASAAGGGIDVGSPFQAIYFNKFQKSKNFGKVHSTSDHLPLMIDI